MSSYDDEDTDPRERHPDGNHNVETAVTLQYLRSKFGSLKGDHEEFKGAISGKVESLEKEVGGYRRKFIFVKGIVYGLFLAAGTGIWAVFDKLKKLGVSLFQ